jgi:hypothetical protein
MLLLEFTSNDKPLIINPKKIVSIHPTRDGRTEVTTTNYNEFYILDDTFEVIYEKIKHYNQYFKFLKVN